MNLTENEQNVLDEIKEAIEENNGAGVKTFSFMFPYRILLSLASKKLIRLMAFNEHNKFISIKKFNYDLYKSNKVVILLW